MLSIKVSVGQASVSTPNLIRWKDGPQIYQKITTKFVTKMTEKITKMNEILVLILIISSGITEARVLHADLIESFSNAQSLDEINQLFVQCLVSEHNLTLSECRELAKIGQNQFKHKKFVGMLG